MKVIKRDGSHENFSQKKVKRALDGAFSAVTGKTCPQKFLSTIVNELMDFKYREDPTQKNGFSVQSRNSITIEEIQDTIEKQLMMHGYHDVAREFIIYRQEHKEIRDWAQKNCEYIENYKNSYNTADATIDDNSNMACKNIAVLNNEIHKGDNLLLNRYMVTQKLKELYPDFDSKQYARDLESHIIYKHDESSFAGAIAPYCVALTMYPFLNNGIREIGGLSAAPKNLDSFCGMYVNLIFAVSSQFAGAVATPEFLLYFDYFARKEWGQNYYRTSYAPAKFRYSNVDDTDSEGIGKVSNPSVEEISIRKQIHQYFQQVVYTINQPAAARGMQSAFVNFSYFDKPFFDGMFGTFYFPDDTQPVWESFNWLQREFMQWFNEERLRCVLTFPVESFALVYKDGEFLDKESAEFVAEEYAKGHSFFTYISDTVDSLSSCCFSGDEVIKIYDKDGIPSIITISDFVKIFSDIENDLGKNVDTKFFIDSYDENAKETGKVKIDGVLMKKYTGKLIKITTAYGDIEVTEDHPILVRNKITGDISTIAAIELSDKYSGYDICVE